MRTLTVFNQVSIDGYFADRKGDMSWAHKHAQDDEWRSFVAGNVKGGGGELLFGRITYQMMESYWPTPAARKDQPEVAEGMTRFPKVVFSRTLNSTSWDNTRLVHGDPAAEVRKLKQAEGLDMVIMGSGSIVSQLARAGLVDEYQLVVNPIVLGGGRTMFEGIETPLAMRPTSTRTFKNGNVLMCYRPAR
jgi:dihydrofolate reductase